MHTDQVRWMIAKFVEDLDRNEPRNYGVILQCEGRVLARFRGEQPDGHINGRQVGLKGPALSNYKAWVRYWQDAVNRNAPLSAGARRAGDAFYLENGGSRLFGDSREPEALLSELFDRLVRTESHDDRPRQVLPDSFGGQVEDLIMRSGLSECRACGGRGYTDKSFWSKPCIKCRRVGFVQRTEEESI